MRLACAHAMPEGCATAIRGFHATEKFGAIFHAHSTLSQGVRGVCASAGARCAPGRARDVRGPCAAPPVAGHAPCARAVNGNAQFMCAACADAIGGGCEVTITRLTCENSASERILGGLRCPLSLCCTVSVPPLSRGVQQNLIGFRNPDPLPPSHLLYRRAPPSSTLCAGQVGVPPHGLMKN